MATAKIGDGAADFQAYVRNLHRAMRLKTSGPQLQTLPVTEARGSMVHNPYSTTIAQMNIFDVRSARNERRPERHSRSFA